MIVNKVIIKKDKSDRTWKQFVGLIFVTALLLLIINCMFLFKEYEKAIEFKRANKGENKKIG